MVNWRLFLDDERLPPEDGNEWVVCRSLDEVKAAIRIRDCLPAYVSFDHDLGLDTPSGLKVAHHLCDLDAFTGYKFPKRFDWYTHSMNPVGRENINAYMANYMEWRKKRDFSET